MAREGNSATVVWPQSEEPEVSDLKGLVTAAAALVGQCPGPGMAEWQSPVSTLAGSGHAGSWQAPAEKQSSIQLSSSYGTSPILLHIHMLSLFIFVIQFWC